ncbi:hypothetical protein Hanom_Chr16g01498271 [Helianthus anomalus]
MFDKTFNTPTVVFSLTTLLATLFVKESRIIARAHRSISSQSTTDIFSGFSPNSGRSRPLRLR